jgi:hypothetical protein
MLFISKEFDLPCEIAEAGWICEDADKSSGLWPGFVTGDFYPPPPPRKNE